MHVNYLFQKIHLILASIKTIIKLTYICFFTFTEEHMKISY